MKLITYLLLAQLVVSLGESEVFEELPVHAVLAGVTMGLGLLDTVAVVLPVLIVMRIILRLGHFSYFSLMFLTENEQKSDLEILKWKLIFEYLWRLGAEAKKTCLDGN